MKTIPHLVLANANRFGDEAAFVARIDGSWRTTTWNEYAAQVTRIAAAMIDAGIEPGDRVAIYSYNTPEWVIFDVAAMAVGAVPVGIYFSTPADGVADILERTRSRIVLAQTSSHAAKIDPSAHEHLDMIVCVEDAPDGVMSWNEFAARGEHVARDRIDERLAALQPGDPATIIFTAAGHGAAVGVVLTHDNLVFTSQSSVDLFEIEPSDSALSYLPLSHIAEQIFTILAPAQVGYRVAFAQSIGRIRVDLPEIQPSIFFGVPLVWNGFERALRKKLDALEGIDRRIADEAMETSRRDIAARNAGRRRSIYARAKMALARRLFTDRVKHAMGFANLKVAFSGAASADTAMLEYFSGIDLPIREVYGLSEATGPSAVTREGDTRFGTVGLPMPGVQIELADDGEILIGGRSVFSGYLDDPAATRMALREGWLHTGDLGTVGIDGFLTISGRKKDIVITTGGKNVCARAVEASLRAMPGITDAIVVGDGHDQLGVLVAVDDAAAAGNPADARAVAESAVKAVNGNYARSEQIRKIGLLPRPLSVEDDERSADGTVHRSVVLERYSELVEDLYR